MEETEQNNNKVSNPIQAASEIFYRPKAVFDTLSKVNNWSWIPFILVVIMTTLPTYLYFQMTDLPWVIDQMVTASMPDASPAELDNAKQMFPPEVLKFTAFAIPIALIIFHAVIAGFLTFVTRNDEKNVQGYTDWYGATWWITMPFVVNGLIALLVLLTYDSGAQIPLTATAPLSLAFIFRLDLGDPMVTLLSNIRLDTIWAVFIATYCFSSWTSFNFQKSIIFGVLTMVIYVGLGVIFGG